MGNFFLQARRRIKHGADRFRIVGAGKFRGDFERVVAMLFEKLETLDKSFDQS